MKFSCALSGNRKIWETEPDQKVGMEQGSSGGAFAAPLYLFQLNKAQGQDCLKTCWR